MIQGQSYIADDVLKEAGIDTSEKDFWNRDIYIGGLQVTNPQSSFIISGMDDIIITIGSKNYKLTIEKRAE